MSPKLSCHLYELTFNDSNKAGAQGALLRYDFNRAIVGYASLPAWPQLGDHTLDKKLQGLARNPHTEPQWSWARLDAEMRQKKIPALPTGTVLPLSHWHLRADDSRDPQRWHELVSRGYLCWKLKLNPSILGDLPLRPLARFASENSVKLRLDGNGSFHSLQELDSLFEMLSPNSVIELFEDPSTDCELWPEIESRWGITLASDWICSGRSHLAVYKPTRDPSVPQDGDFTITTAFDHPLGLNYTAFESLRHRNHSSLLSPLGIEHPGLYTCDGLPSDVTFGEIGFGWGQLLEEIEWHRL
jgi:hypothetical protein